MYNLCLHAALLAAWSEKQVWYILPLVVAISLVYGATRHEYIRPILHHATKAATWIVGFLVVVFGILFLCSWNL